MSESLARLVVTAVLVEGRTKTEVARDHGLSRQWVHELTKRYLAEGDGGLAARTRRPRSNPARVPDAIVALRKELEEQSLDAGAHTIAYHLTRRGFATPSVATIWRILVRRGFVTPQPQKRPKAASIRFQAEMPNERLARRHHPLEARRRHRRRDLERDRRSLPVPGGLRCPGGVQGRRRRGQLSQSGLGTRVPDGAADR